MCMGILYACMSVNHMHTVLKERDKGVKSPGTRIAGSHELLCGWREPIGAEPIEDQANAFNCGSIFPAQVGWCNMPFTISQCLSFFICHMGTLSRMAVAKSCYCSSKP